MLNSSGQIWLSGATTGQTIAIEVESGLNASISIDDAKVRRITGKTTSGSSISMSDFYSRYYRALAASATTYYTYSPYSQQGGTGNGSEALSGPAPAKEDGGYRSGSRYFPVAEGFGQAFTNYCYTIDTGSTTSQITLLRNILASGTYSAMFSNVSTMQTSGGDTYFTATLNTGYYFNVVDATGVVRTYLRPNVTYTFLHNSAYNGIYSDTSWTYAGAIYFYGYLAEGMVFTNTTGAPGTINMYWSFGGVAKVALVQVKVDTGAATNSIPITGASTSGSLSNQNVPAGASVIIQGYWWGAGPSFTNSSYITGGSWQVGAVNSIV
jgi:hypothetical protein